MIEIILITITAILVILLVLESMSKFRKKVDKFPGPKAYPLIGNSLNMTRQPDQMFNILRGFRDTFKSTYRFWAGPEATVHIVTAEDAEKILTSNVNITKNFGYDFLHSWLGTGLLTSTGNKWQKRRKILTPTYHFSILRKFVDIIIENTENIVDELEQETCKEKTNVMQYITKSTLSIICETAMGTKLRTSDKTDSKYVQAVHEINNLIAYRVVSPWFYNDFIFKLFPAGWSLNKYLHTLHTFTNNVIEEREKHFDENDVDVSNDDDGMTKKRLAMLDLLIKEERNGNIDRDGIREEVDTFMFEGHDTTSMALCFSLLLLANHPDIQDKILEELHTIFDTKRKTTMQDLQNMKYLENVIKECIRLYPSVPIIAREITEDLELSDAIVPVGTSLLVHIFDVHRDPKYFPDPEKFDPDRFLPENAKGRHPFAYIPFSGGARNCIGQKFAMLEMKSILSSILWNYELKAIDKPEDMKLLFDVILRNKNPIYVKFAPRKQTFM